MIHLLVTYAYVHVLLYFVDESSAKIIKIRSCMRK